MAEAVAGDLVVAHLDHELRLQRLPLFGAFGAPAAWSSRRLAGKARRRDAGLELRGQRRAVLVGDGCGEADMIELAGIVVEPEQQRANLLAAATVAKAADHAVGGAVLLHFHHRPLAGDVRSAALFGHDAVERRATLLEPARGFRETQRIGRELEVALLFGRRKKLLEHVTPLAQRRLDQALARRIEQHVEQDEDRRRLCGETLDTALSRMNALKQRIEGDLSIPDNCQLAIEHERARLQALERGDHLRKIACERLAGLCLEIDLVARAEGEAPEAIPFRLVLPIAFRQLLDELCFHRLDVERHGQGRERCGRRHGRKAARAPKGLFGAAADQINDAHADAESHDQRRREVVLHHLLGLLHRIVRPSSRGAQAAIGDLAERAGEVAQIVPYGVELVVQILRVELLQKPAGLVLSSSPTHHRHVLLSEAWIGRYSCRKIIRQNSEDERKFRNNVRAPAREGGRSANQLWRSCYFAQASMPAIAFSASSFELYEPPMFFMVSPGMSCIMVHLWLAGSKAT